MNTVKSTQSLFSIEMVIALQVGACVDKFLSTCKNDGKKNVICPCAGSKSFCRKCSFNAQHCDKNKIQ